MVRERTASHGLWQQGRRRLYTAHLFGWYGQLGATRLLVESGADVFATGEEYENMTAGARARRL